MKRFDIGQAIQITANVGVIVGIVFLAVETRTNTATNRIAIEQGLNANYMLLNSQLAGNPQLAAIIHKADTGASLEQAEAIQYSAWVRQFIAQGQMVMRMYDQGVATSDQVRNAFRGPRALAESSQAFRRTIESEPTGSDRLRDLILNKDGFSRWLTRND